MAQHEIITIDDILNTIKQSKEYNNLEEQYKQNIQIKPGFNFLEKISLQTETDRFQLKRQEYLAKFYFNGAREINAVHNKYNAIREKELQLLLKWKNDYLTELYEKANKLIWYQNQLDIYYSLLENVQQRISFFRQQSNIKSVNSIDDYLKAEDDRISYEDKVSSIRSEIQSNWIALKMVNASVADIKRIDTAHCITIQELHQIQNTCEVMQNPEWIIQSLDQKIQKQNYQIARANQTQMFDFTQIKYNARKSEVLQREFSVSMGIVLPYKSSNKLQQSDAKIKFGEELTQTEILTTKLNKQCLELDSHMKQKIAEYDRQQLLWQATYQYLSSPELLKTSFIGPAQILKIEELKLKHQLRLNDINYDAMTDYIEYLSITGKFINNSNHNFLIHQ